MKRIFIASRFAGYIRDDGKKITPAMNIKRAQRLARYVVLRGNAPFVPHLYLPQSLDDNHPKERDLGIKSAMKFLEVCDEVWVDSLFGISKGMLAEIRYAQSLGKTCDFTAFDGIDDLLPERDMKPLHSLAPRRSVRGTTRTQRRTRKASTKRPARQVPVPTRDARKDSRRRIDPSVAP